MFVFPPTEMEFIFNLQKQGKLKLLLSCFLHLLSQTVMAVQVPQQALALIIENISLR